jgi:hypothetical protein
MLRRLVAATGLALAALTCGCTTMFSPGPQSDNVPQAAVDADYHDCESRAYVSTALVKSAGEASDRQEAIMDECMKEKGYKIK